jgi:hypothetical protein
MCFHFESNLPQQIRFYILQKYLCDSTLDTPAVTLVRICNKRKRVNLMQAK